MLKVLFSILKENKNS